MLYNNTFVYLGCSNTLGKRNNSRKEGDYGLQNIVSIGILQADCVSIPYPGQKSYSYRYVMKNMHEDQTRHLCGKDLYWGDNAFTPKTVNYQGLEYLAPNLLNGVSGQSGLIHLACVCKEHAGQCDCFFV